MEQKKIKVMTVFGTRPEAIKMAPIVLELQKHPDTIVPVVAVTAQHREMLDQVLNLFHIKPDHDLNIMAAGQTLFDITTRAMMGLDKVLTEEKPDIVLVHGDTTTTFAGALAAYYHQTAVDAGTVKLIGTDRERVYEEAKKLLTDKAEYSRMAESVNPYGDGKAAARIIQAILYHYGLADGRPDVFEG